MLRYNTSVLLTVVASVLLLTGCQKNLDSEIAALKEQVQAMESMLSSMNKDVKALSEIVSAIEQNDMIKEVNQLSDGSYRLTFKSGTTIVLRNGTDGVMPLMGIQKDPETDYYYWTVQMGPQSPVNWLYDEKHLRVRASAVVPKVKVETAGDTDYWYYSFDEEVWYLLDGSGQTPAHGTPGSPMFSEVDCSFDGFVTITLADGNVFQIPTQAKFDELNEMCDAINRNMSVIADLVAKVDRRLFVKTINRVEKDGKLEGYDIGFADGRTISLRNGKDNEEVRTISLGWSSAHLACCWMLDWEPLIYEGKVLMAEPEMIPPTLGAVAVDGCFYFTIKVGDGESQLLLDAEGNPVPASPVRYFEDIAEKDGGLELTLSSLDENGDNVKLLLYRMEDCTPSLNLISDSWDISREAGEIAFTASIDSLGINEASEFEYEIEAVAVDSVCTVQVGEGVLVSGESSLKKSIRHPVLIQLKESAVVGDDIRIALFLSWENHTIMKVAEFTVRQ